MKTSSLDPKEFVSNICCCTKWKVAIRLFLTESQNNYWTNLTEVLYKSR